MMREMADLGFDHAELSHGIKISLVPGIMRAVEEKVIRISSTHNFCPLPAGVTQPAPNLFEPSAWDAREHLAWVRHTQRSIDFASEMGARVLVCHLGSVGYFWRNPGSAVRRYVERRPGFKPAEDKDYQRLLEKSMARLRRRMGRYWAQTQASVREVLAYAGDRGVKLGLENREKFEELPIDADFPEFLAALPAGASAGYWHDCGHAQLKQGEGLLDHRTHLEKNAAWLIGFHLHDVSLDGHDHQPVGTGSVDFAMVSSFWRPEHLLILELSPRVEKEGVLASKERIDALRANAPALPR
jgi:sugar phosphate isomerase/epimerase